MNQLQTQIVVNALYEGIHAWSDCNIPEVGFLRHPHRHIFHIKAVKTVGHDDREIEIIKFKHSIIHYLNNRYGGHFGDLSCEMIAKELLLEFDMDECQVLEDGENGAIVKIKTDAK